MRILLLIGLLAYIVGPIISQSSSPLPAVAEPEQPSAQSSTDIVVANVTVITKKGGHLTGLDKSAFTVLDNKVPRDIIFFSNADEPLSIAVLFDLSASMQGGPMAEFSQFINASNRSNEYFVIGFGEQTQLFADGVDGDKALSTVSGLLSISRPKGNTAFYDACHFGVEQVLRGRYLSKAVLIFSDGEDNVSKRSQNDLRRLAKETPVMFLAVDPPGNTLPTMQGQSNLDELATISGGRAFFPYNAKDLIEVLNILAARLRNQYTLGFTPENNAGGDKWHRLKVEVKLPTNSPFKQKDVLVQSRKGYYLVP